MRQSLLLALLAAGCGRIGFDATASGDGGLDAQDTIIDVDLTTGLGPLSFRRSTPATYIDATGVMRIALEEEPRFDHHPVTRKPRGLLVELGSSNQLLDSSHIDDPNWPATGQMNVSLDVALAPDGTMTADELVDVDTVLESRRLQGQLGSTAMLPWVYSGFLRAGTRSRATLSAEILNGTSQIQTHVNVDLTTGSIVSANGSPTAYGIEPYGNGWFRVWIRLDNNGTGNNDFVISFWADRAAPAATTGSFYVWGAQLEQSATVSSYIPTTTTTVSRAPDRASFELVPPAPSGTLLASASVLTDRDAGQSVACLAQSDGSDGGCLQRDGITDRTRFARTSAQVLGTPWPDGTPRWLGCVWTPDVQRLWEPAGAMNLAAPMSPPEVVNLAGLDGHIQQLRVWTRTLTDDELAAQVP